MKSSVYWGSPRQSRWDAKETLPAKLDLIIDRLNIRDRVKDEMVVIKLHVGNGIGYSTVHPVFVRKVVQAVKDGGGTPFIADVVWDVEGCASRGYTAEVLGCPIVPSAGLEERYFYTHAYEYKNIKEWKVAGMIQDATFLINFAHAKGHPSNGYGGCQKNLALGCMIGETRSAIHDTNHFDPYWNGEGVDAETRKKIIDACPFGAIVEDRDHPGELHLHFEPCNQCGRCLQAAPPGSLKIQAVNFHSFMEANAISTKIALSTFAPEKATHLCLATNITPLCDCFGFTSLPILPDVGVFGSDDIVAIDQAVLDMLGEHPLYEENIPTNMEVVTHEGHPLSWLHGPHKNPYMITDFGEKYGLGTRQYELVDVLPVVKHERTAATYISAS